MESRWRDAEEGSLRSTAVAVAQLVATTGIRPTGDSKDQWNLMENASNVEVAPIFNPSQGDPSKGTDTEVKVGVRREIELMTARIATWAREPKNRYLIRTEVPFLPPLNDLSGVRVSRVVQFEGEGIPSAWRNIFCLWTFGCVAASIAILLPGRSFSRLLGSISQWSRLLEDHRERLRPVDIHDRKLDPLVRKWIPAFPLAITEIREGWEQSEAASLRTANILNGMREGVLTIDPQSRVVFANPAACRMLEIANKVFVGKTLVEVIRQPRVCSLLMQAISDESGTEIQVREVELEIGTIQKSFLRLRAARLPVAYGSGAILTISDETQLHRLENMRREFTANVSHELKTPLAAIKAYAETLLMGALDDEVHRRRFVERIGEQSNRLESLIQDLLKLARIQAAPNLNSDRFHLEDVAKQSMEAYSAVAQGKQVELRLERPSIWPTLCADREAVTTILNNLIGNAVRYTNEGGKVDVTLSVTGGKLLISVRDTGVGIAQEDHERIFERFFRVDKARTIDVGGTGLGLSIVKNLVLAMHGEIHLDSELGKGSHFQVILPVNVET